MRRAVKGEKKIPSATSSPFAWGGEKGAPSPRDFDAYYLRAYRAWSPNSPSRSAREGDDDHDHGDDHRGVGGDEGRPSPSPTTSPAPSRRREDEAKEWKASLRRIQDAARIEALDGLCAVAFDVEHDGGNLEKRLEGEQNRIMSRIQEQIQGFIMSKLRSLEERIRERRGGQAALARQAARREIEEAKEAAQVQARSLLAMKETKAREDKIRAEAALQHARRREEHLLQLRNSLDRGFSHSIIKLRDDLGSLVDERVVEARAQARLQEEEDLSELRKEYEARAKREYGLLEERIQDDTEKLILALGREFEVSRTQALAREEERLKEEGREAAKELETKLTEERRDEMKRREEETRERESDEICAAELRRARAIASQSRELEFQAASDLAAMQDEVQSVIRASLETFSTFVQASDPEILRVKARAALAASQSEDEGDENLQPPSQLASCSKALQLERELRASIDIALDLQSMQAARIISIKRKISALESRDVDKISPGVCHECADIFAENEEMLRALNLSRR